MGLNLNPIRSTATLAVASFAAVMLPGCSGSSSKDKVASQIAARVNKEELSVHQINFQLQRQPGLRPEQADGAGRQTLERLIDEELAVQKAIELKLDRDPKVLQAIEASRREVLARAYLERIGDAASRPAPEEVRKYYDENPALFKERKIYTLQEISIEADSAQFDDLRAKLQSSRTTAEFIESVKAGNLRYTVNQSVRPAEQLPLSSLSALAKLRDGQAMLVPAAGGGQVVAVVATKLAPVEEAKAQPAIEQFLWNENRRRMVQSDIKALRQSGKIEYVGKFAEPGKREAGAASAAR